MAPVMSALGHLCPPPPRALPLLDRAHILLHTRADMCTVTEYGAIEACGIMVYGVGMWRLAQRNARSILIDEEEGMVLVDYEEGRGEILDLEVECVEDEDGELGRSGKMVADEVGALVVKATAEIKKWDAEIGKRVGSVLRGLQVS